METTFRSRRWQYSVTFFLWLSVVAFPQIAAAQLSGTYFSAPGTTATYYLMSVDTPTATLPADITVNFSGGNPTSSLTATIHQPIIGDLPENLIYGIAGFFPLVVSGTSTDGRDFQGQLLDQSQYYFDWQFEPADDGKLTWTGQVSWIGGRIEFSTIDEGALLIPTVPGDYNRNGEVDAADYVVWRDELVDGGTGRADGNYDGQVDAADYDLWKASFGQAAAGNALGGITTPEPTSMLSLLLGVLPIMIGRRAASR